MKKNKQQSNKKVKTISRSLNLLKSKVMRILTQRMKTWRS